MFKRDGALAWFTKGLKQSTKHVDQPPIDVRRLRPKQNIMFKLFGDRALTEVRFLTIPGKRKTSTEVASDPE